MEEKVFNCYVEFEKYCTAIEEAYFNNEDIKCFNGPVRLTGKARDEMYDSGCLDLEEFMQELNRRVDSHLKKADERIRIHENQEE